MPGRSCLSAQSPIPICLRKKCSGAPARCWSSFPAAESGSVSPPKATLCCGIWLENLNLRGSYKAVIMDYIREKRPQLLPLYQEIYQKGNRAYWELLDMELKSYAAEIGLDYVTNDDSMKRPFDAPPVVVNFFYHEQIKKSAKKGGDSHA